MERSDWGPPCHVLGGYREYAPPPELSRIVDVVWTYDLPEGDGTPVRARHRVLPEPGLSLCFWGHRRAGEAGSDVTLIVVGPVRSVRPFAPEPGTRLEAVRIRPEWCRELLGIDPREHADGLDRLREVQPRRAVRLRDAYGRSAGPGAGLRVLFAALREWSAGFRPSRAAATAGAALDRVRALRSTNIGLDALARELDVSERHLRRVIRRTTGSGPKRHHRVSRLTRLMAAADRDPRPSWSRLAARFGFYDQSHLIGECRLLTGSRPTELHAERWREALALGRSGPDTVV